MTTTTSSATLRCDSVEATRSLGARLGAAAVAGDVIAVRGPLGAGKTELARGVARGLGVDGRVASPTFVLLAEHDGPTPFFHLDAYRLDGADDARAGGLLDERLAEGVVLIEWPERLGAALSSRRLDVAIDGAGDEPRVVRLTATDDRHRRLVAAAGGDDGSARRDTVRGDAR